MALVSRLTGSSGRVKAALGVALAVMVPLTAVPLASNRAVWWLIWTVAFACLLVLSLVRAGIVTPRATLPVFSRRGLLTLAAVPLLWTAIQLLPLGPYLPEALVRMPAGLQDLAGATISTEPRMAMAGALRYTGYLLLGILIYNLATRGERVGRMALVLYLGVVAQAVWALAALNLLGDIALWGEKTAYLGFATGTFINRNSLATFLGFGIVLGIGLLAERLRAPQLRATRRRGRLARLGLTGVIVFIGQAVLVLALLETQSRLGLAATLAGSGLALGLVRISQGVGTLRLMAEGAIALGVAVCGIGLFLAGDGVLNRFLFTESEGVHRLAIYSQALELVRLRPWTGFGMDAFSSAFEAVRRSPLDGPVHFDLAHNSYLTLWVEFGLIAGSAPMLALMISAIYLLRALSAEDSFFAPALAGLGAITIAAVHSLGDFSLEIPANAYLFVSILALGLGHRANGKPAGRPEGFPAPAPSAPGEAMGVARGQRLGSDYSAPSEAHAVIFQSVRRGGEAIGFGRGQGLGADDCPPSEVPAVTFRSARRGDAETGSGT